MRTRSEASFAFVVPGRLTASINKYWSAGSTPHTQSTKKHNHWGQGKAVSNSKHLMEQNGFTCQSGTEGGHFIGATCLLPKKAKGFRHNCNQFNNIHLSLKKIFNLHSIIFLNIIFSGLGSTTLQETIFNMQCNIVQSLLGYIRLTWLSRSRHLMIIHDPPFLNQHFLWRAVWGVFSAKVSFLLEDIMMNTFGHNFKRKKNILSNFFYTIYTTKMFCYFSEDGMGQATKLLENNDPNTEKGSCTTEVRGLQVNHV